MPLESGPGGTDYQSMGLSRAGWFWIGVAGFAAGLLAIATDNSLLAGIAGICALVLGVASRWSRRVEAEPEDAVATDDVVVNLDSVERSTSVRLASIAADPASASDGTNGVDSPIAASVEEIRLESLVSGPDPLTDIASGLYNERFFRATLGSRVSAARRHLRPIGVALIDVLLGVHDGPAHPPDPATVADGIRLTLRDADTSCRLEDGRFALILEDTPENGAVWTVERLRRRLAADDPELTLWAGVACYPAHAFDAEELLERAEQALTAAREWRQDRIEIATSE